MDLQYWQKQTPDKPLYPDIEWNRPERRDQAGTLGIIGGNKHGFASVADAHSLALKTGVGHIKVLLPDCLKRSLPAAAPGELIFAACNASGSLAAESYAELIALSQAVDGVLLVGDAGRSSETAIVYERFVREYTGPLTVTRDAADLLKNSAHELVERPATTLVLSFAQVQKLFQAVFYPKILTFSMQLMQLVEALHKFTTTYPITIATFHNEQLIIASAGEVVTQKWDTPLAIWRGSVATRAAVYWLWHPSRPLQSIAGSIAK